MLTPAELESVLRAALPRELHAQVAPLAQLLGAVASGALAPEAAQAHLAHEPALRQALTTLGGSHTTAGGALLSFGQAGQLGDVRIDDVASGNIVRLTINNYFGDARSSEASPAGPPQPQTAPPQVAPPAPESPAADDAGPTSSATFVVGPPILHPRAFFGRETIVKRIFGLLKRLPLQNAVIIGPRRSGKTSLLHYLRAITRVPAGQLRPGQRNDWLEQPERYQWVMLDFQDARLGRKEGLLRALLGGMGLPVPEPCTLDRAMDMISGGLRRPTVVLLDEVGKALQSYRDLDDDVWESLRALGPQVGGNLGFVLATHATPVALAHDSGHSSPFFNIFGYTTNLGPLSDAEARQLIASAPLPFPEEDVAWIIAQSGRWPILLQALCRERLASLDEGENGEEWREAALEQLAPFRGLLDTGGSP